MCLVNYSNNNNMNFLIISSLHVNEGCSCKVIEIQAGESIHCKVIGGKIEFIVKGIQIKSEVSKIPFAIEDTKKGS